MLDCGRVNALRLRLPDPGQGDIALEPGVHAIGRRADGSAGPVARGEAAVQFCIDRRGTWLQVQDGTRGVHVNGRPVRRMALLRAGDVVFVDGLDLLLVADAPVVPPPDGDPPDESDTRMVLRGIGGPNHGRCFALDAPCVIGCARDCCVRIDGAGTSEHHVRLEPRQGGIVLRDLQSAHGSIVNGHRVRDAWLQAGDQIVIGAHRFVVESASPAMHRAHGDDAASGHESDPPEPVAVPRRGWVRRVPWLLLAALLLAAALSLLLMYGAR